MTFIYDVGLSYATDQASLAKRLYDVLSKRGYSVFHDRERSDVL